MANPSGFRSRSLEAVSEFLQSVVVVDDQAFLYQGEVVGVLEPPKRRLGDVNDETESRPNMTDRQLIRNPQDLNAKALIDAFADKGLVCAVLRPGVAEVDDGDLEHITLKVANRADIVVLDWRINNESDVGRTTLGLIKGILRSDDEQEGRLRLIAIYTGEPDLIGVADEVGKCLSDLNLNFDRDDFVFTLGSTRIVLYAKEGARANSLEAQARVFSEVELSERLVEDFVEVTEGLLSNVALRSLSAIRSNTHRILAKFSSELDAPYVAHRAMMSPPEEAAEHPLPLLASEILDVLQSCSIEEHLSAREIVGWLQWKIDNGHSFSGRLQGRFNGMTTEDVCDALFGLLHHGVEDETAPNKHVAWSSVVGNLKKYKKSEANTITALLAPDEASGGVANLSLAMLMSIRSRYSNPLPLLSLGAIVACDVGDGKGYWLCVQPMCDSVRIVESRSFPFLRMREEDVLNGKFDVVVKDGGDLKALRVSYRPHEMRLWSFKPVSPYTDVRASKNDGRWVFSAECGFQCVWIADMKPAHAQRVANLLADSISRVGLTESEWLRRMAR